MLIVVMAQYVMDTRLDESVQAALVDILSEPTLSTNIYVDMTAHVSHICVLISTASDSIRSSR
jgi:hypothetical protein